MNKKLMAVAIAGALGAPGLAFAQASTVQIYGTLSTGFEWRNATGADATAAPAAGATAAASVAAGASSVRGAAGASSLGGGYVAAGTPAANQNTRTSTTGPGSNFGLRGREDLGGGMYAGFQLEMGIHLGGDTAFSGAGTGQLVGMRNSGLWLGTSVGEFGVGVWDTPFTINMSQMGAHSVYGNSSTNMSAGLLGGLSVSQATFSGQTLSQYCGAVGITTVTNCFSASTAFSRRQGNSVWYQSPSWGGFRVRAIYAANQPDTTAASGSAAGLPTELKPSIWGISGTYANGPLYVALAYEKHNDYSAAGLRIAGSTAGPGIGAGAVIGLGTLGGVALASFSTLNIANSNDWGWNLNARYTFGGSGFSAGFYWERLSYSWSYTTSVAGAAPLASDVTGLSRDAYRLDAAFATGPHTFGIQYGRAQDISGTTIGNGFNGNQTGVQDWMFAYAYSFSKRTSLFGYYNRITNDTNARAAGIVFNGITTAAGADPTYYGVGIRHTF